MLERTRHHLSSEKNEANSWFSESRGVDRRISSVEEWQKATDKDSLFVLDVPWLPTGLTAGQILDRIFAINGAMNGAVATAEDVGRIVFNYRK